ncbi:MAG TPA: DUF6624 domain-containing protein [Sphingomonas sp.]|nr:DUF6624 domain-containing protein [Sphingomonas sp.]
MRKLWVIAAFMGSTTGTAWAQVPSLPPDALVFGCGAREKVEAEASAQLARAVASPAEQEEHRNAARAAIRKADALRRDALAGKPAEAPYSGASRFAALSVRAPSPELAELYRRVAADQFARLHLTAALQRVGWAAGLSDHARSYAYYVIASDVCGVDEANTRWLKAQLDRSGWFTVSKYGAEADSAAWLLVQHADDDLAFQTRVLAILEALVGSKDTDPRNYAYLYDRVAVNGKRPQRYGTQGRCTVSGSWEPREIEDPARLDERRGAVGLEPEAEYRARFTCPKAPPRG